MYKKIVILSFILCMVFFSTTTAFAQEFDFEQKGSISVTLLDQESQLPIEGMELAVYRIATIESDEKGSWKFVYEDVFEKEGVVFEDPEFIKKLELVVEQYDVSSISGITDMEGKAVFKDLPLGLYFVKQVVGSNKAALCKSFCITIPLQNGDSYVYDVDASPKAETIKLISVTIKKVWNTGKAVKPADFVTVQLLQDGKVIETVTLNNDNKWTITLENMPMSDSYSVKEVNVPQGFTATYMQNDYEFTITNTATLAQTGQLVWPIPILVMSGLFFLFAGMIIIGKSRGKDE